MVGLKPIRTVFFGNSTLNTQIKHLQRGRGLKITPWENPHIHVTNMTHVTFSKFRVPLLKAHKQYATEIIILISNSHNRVYFKMILYHVVIIYE